MTALGGKLGKLGLDDRGLRFEGASRLGHAAKLALDLDLAHRAFVDFLAEFLLNGVEGVEFVDRAEARRLKFLDPVAERLALAQEPRVALLAQLPRAARQRHQVAAVEVSEGCSVRRGK